MLIKYIINDTKINPGRLIRISTHSQIGDSFLNALKGYGYSLIDTTEYPLEVKELGVTIKEVVKDF